MIYCDLLAEFTTLKGDNFNDSFLSGCFFTPILVEWTIGYADNTKSKFRSIAGAAQVYT